MRVSQKGRSIGCQAGVLYKDFSVYFDTLESLYNTIAKNIIQTVFIQSYSFEMVWRCVCGTIIMKSFAIPNCTACGGRKAAGESLIIMRGDWWCSHCQKSNFARNVKCFTCKTPKVIIWHLEKQG